jgi:hypothetical protein
MIKSDTRLPGLGISKSIEGMNDFESVYRENGSSRIAAGAETEEKERGRWAPRRFT